MQSKLLLENSNTTNFEKIITPETLFILLQLIVHSGTMCCRPKCSDSFVGDAHQQNFSKVNKCHREISTFGLNNIRDWHALLRGRYAVTVLINEDSTVLLLAAEIHRCVHFRRVSRKERKAPITFILTVPSSVF